MSLWLCHVVWLDSEADANWTPLESITEELDITHSAGFLIKEAETFILLALSYDETTQSINTFKKIPLAAIQKITKIKKVKI